MSDLRKWKALVENASKLVEDPVADADYTDHEVSMAKSQMLSSMKSINRIAKHLATKSESEGLEGWTASKLTMAEDYLQVVADYFDGKEINEAAKQSLSEGKTVAVKFYDEFDSGYTVHIGDNTLSLNGGEVNKNLQWDRPKGHAFSDAEVYVSKWMYKTAKNWNEVHAWLKRVRDTGDEKALLAAVQKAFKTGSMAPKIVEGVEEGYKVLPPMDPKYVARKGLEGPFSTLSGKVVYYDPKEGKYYDPDTDMYMSYDEFRRYDDDYKGMKNEHDEISEAHQIDWPYEEMEQQAYNAIRHDFHAYDAFDHLFSNAKDEYRRDWLRANKDDIIKMFAQYGLQTESLEESEALTEEQFDEAAGEKDACYHKVKSRYKVWPSAYASGALVQCRKVGAKNWGNSKKK